jgi:hypothetical protein
MALGTETNTQQFALLTTTETLSVTLKAYVDADYYLLYSVDGDEDFNDLVLDSDYSVGGADADGEYSNGSTITLLFTPADGSTILVVRYPEVIQANDYKNMQIFHRGAIEDEFDRIYMIMQEHKRAIDTSVKWSPLSTNDEPWLPEPQAGYLIGWDQAGNLANLTDTLVGGGGVTDHGVLTGLGDDDHTQYLLADGTRSATSLTVIDSITTPLVTRTSANLTLSTITSGDIVLNSVGIVDIDTAGGFALNDDSGSYFTITAAGAMNIISASGQNIGISAVTGNLNLQSLSGQALLKSNDNVDTAVVLNATVGGLLFSAATVIDLDSATVDIDTTGAITMDSGSFSIDSALDSNISVTGADLTISTITSGGMVLNAVDVIDVDADEVWIDTVAEMDLTAGTIMYLDAPSITVDADSAYLAAYDDGSLAVISGATEARIQSGALITFKVGGAIPTVASITDSLFNTAIDFSVATDKFTVAAATGSTVIGGLVYVDVTAGTVGVGESSPTEIFELKNSAGNATSVMNGANGYNALFEFQEADVMQWRMGFFGTSEDLVYIDSGGSSRMTFTQNGKIGIGNNADDPFNKFHIKGNGTIPGNQPLRLERALAGDSDDNKNAWDFRIGDRAMGTASEAGLIAYGSLIIGAATLAADFAISTTMAVDDVQFKVTSDALADGLVSGSAGVDVAGTLGVVGLSSLDGGLAITDAASGSDYIDLSDTTGSVYLKMRSATNFDSALWFVETGGGGNLWLLGTDTSNSMFRLFDYNAAGGAGNIIEVAEGSLPDALTIDSTGVTMAGTLDVTGLVTVQDPIDIATNAAIRFLTQGSATGITYEDDGGDQRFGINFPGSDVVALMNRASNGVVEIRANTATAGAGGEVTSATFSDTGVDVAGTLDVTGLSSLDGGLSITDAANGTVYIELTDTTGAVTIRLDSATDNDASIQFQENNVNVWLIGSDTDNTRFRLYDYGTGANVIEVAEGSLSDALTIDSTGVTMAGNLAVNLDIIMSNTGGVRADTSDGSDNAEIRLAGGGDFQITRGASVRVHGNEHATDPGRIELVMGDVAGGGVDILSAGGNPTSSFEYDGTVSFSGTVTLAGASADQDVVLYFDMDRDWRFIQEGDDSGASLELQSVTAGKTFRITDSAGGISATFVASTTAADRRANFVPDGGTVNIAGGYGDSGVSFNESGNFSANGNGIVDGTFSVGGGYGSTGVTIEADGDILTSGNIGVKTETPNATLQVVGDAHFGEDTTNYLEMQSDGHLVLHGTATVWDDQQVVLGTVGFGASAPTWTAYKGGQILAFSKNQSNEITFNVQFSHKVKIGSDIEFHVHPIPPDDTTGTVYWRLTVSFADIDSSFPAETTYNATQTIAANSGDDHLVFEISADVGSPGGVSSGMICSLTRVGASDTYDNDIYLFALDAHAEMDKIGSDTEFAA